MTERIIGCAIKVSNVLGIGYLEKVYENALAYEIGRQGILVQQQHPIAVSYEGVIVGNYVADLLVDSAIVVELKATKSIEPVHEAQMLNYLRATGLKIGLILNFGSARLGIKRLLR